MSVCSAVYSERHHVGLSSVGWQTITGLLPGPLVVVALAIFSPRTDDPKHPQGAPPLPLSGVSTEKHGQHEEMERVFREVERSLRKADRLLDRAGAPSRATTDSAQSDEAGHIGSLLEKTLEQGRSALSGIDRILELADHPHPGGGT